MFCEMGLWLPSQTALMTEEGMADWYTDRKSATEGVHPDDYDKIVTDYVPNYGVTVYQPPGWPKAWEVLQPAFDAMKIGDKTVEEAMSEAVPEANAALEEAGL